eukprot:scaffold8766_cov119-Isochrysis_galbana.AAC.2
MRTRMIRGRGLLNLLFNHADWRMCKPQPEGDMFNISRWQHNHSAQRMPVRQHQHRRCTPAAPARHASPNPQPPAHHTNATAVR